MDKMGWIKNTLVIIFLLLITLFILHFSMASLLINSANITRVLPANHTFINGTVAFNVSFGSSQNNNVTDIKNVTFIIFNTTNMIILVTNTSTNQSFYQTRNNTALFGDGVYNITIQTFNNTGAGGQGNFTPAIRNLTIDNNPASIILNNPPNEQNTTNNTVTLNWTIFDSASPLARCDLRIDGTVNLTNTNSPNGTANFTTYNFVEGKHYWNVTCRDTVNNTNISSTFVFNIATSLPTIFLNAPPDNNVSNSTQNVFNFTPISLAYTTLDSCNLTLDPTNSSGGAVINSSSFFPNGTASLLYNSILDGNHTWNVRCTDSAGNVNFSSNRSLTVDTTPPTLNIFTKDTDGIVKTRFGFGEKVKLVCNRTESVSGISDTRIDIRRPAESAFSTLINSSLGSTIDLEFEFEGTQELGKYIARCEAKDLAGNQNRTNSTFEIETAIITSTSGFSVPSFSAPVGKVKVNTGVTSEVGALPPEGVSRLLAKGATLIVTIKNEDHKVTVLDVTDTEVTLMISSTPMEITVKKGESGSVDVDNDGTNDLKVTFHKLFANKWADLTLEAVATPAAPLIKEPIRTPAQPPKKPLLDLAKFSNAPLLIIILILLVIVVIAYFVIQKKR